jgi:hypothetical protein
MNECFNPLAVIAGLDPAIHPASQRLLTKKLDARVTSAFHARLRRAMPAHDEGE